MKKLLFITIWIFILIEMTMAADPLTEYDKNWPQWRGPKATGVALFGNPPLQWSETKNIRWKVPIPGAGHATPVVWGNQVIILTATETTQKADPGKVNAMKQQLPSWQRNSGKVPTATLNFEILSVNRSDGRILWQKVMHQQLPHEGTHTDGSWASGSPITDGKHIYAYFGSFGLYCLDMQGNVLWQKDFGDMEIKASFGEGTTPVLYKDKLVVNWDHEGQSFIVVLDKNTGKQIWKKNRDEVTSWATPFVVEQDGRPQVVINATGHVSSYDLETGDILWESTGMTGNVIPSPVYSDGRIYLMSGFRGNAFQAIDLGKAKGDVKSSNALLWSYNKNTSYVPSALLYQNMLYFFKENREILTCLNALTGQPHYESLRLKDLKGVYASPVAVNGRVYLTGRNGVSVVLKADPVFEILATNTLNESFTASPAIVGDEMFLRGQEYLYCIANK
ncbi:PQQ-like beta-propeller repeat protein [candidate division KSB1 bacterium]|nr:PQQ-like beta-propeller repeat protein [candidate division KSB1 bacterium]